MPIMTEAETLLCVFIVLNEAHGALSSDCLTDTDSSCLVLFLAQTAHFHPL